PELFLYHARRVRAGFELDEQTLTAIRQICQAVAGVPLAIELAAATIRQLTVAEVARQVKRDATALSGDAWGAPQRHHSIQAAFDHSWDLMGPEERELFARLSIFRGDFTLEAAQAVAAATEERLQSLVDRRLLHEDGDNRYHLHELLRQYAAQKLAELASEQDAVARRHMRYYAAVLASEPPGTPPARKAIGESLDNIRWAWDTAVRLSDFSLLIQMVLPLVIFYYGRRRWHEEAERRLSAAVTAVRARDDVDRPEVQRALGNLTAWLGYFTEDEQAFFRLADEAVRMLRPFGEGRELATALSFRGDAAYGIRHAQSAVDDLLESRAIFDELGDPVGLSAPLNSLCLVYGFLGDYEAAERYGRQCIELSDQIGLDKMSSMVRTHLSNAMRARGEYERARVLATEALQLAEEIESAEHKILSLLRLAQTAFYSGNYEEAEDYLSTILDLPDLDEEQPVYQIQALALFGELYYIQDRFEAANGYLTRALARALELKTVEAMPPLLMVTAHVLEDDMPSTAVEILALLRDHRRADAEMKSEAAQRLKRLEGRLQSDVFETACSRGHNVDLEELAQASLDLFLEELAV
ncbi:MAG: ATP-binding protein, partial [Chloroflexota bacterium]